MTDTSKNDPFLVFGAPKLGEEEIAEVEAGDVGATGSRERNRLGPSGPVPTAWQRSGPACPSSGT